MIDYLVRPCERIEIRAFIEKHHYSKKWIKLVRLCNHFLKQAL